MEQGRKIIVSTDDGSAESLETPHFDKEATLAARRVVPLAEKSADDSDVRARASLTPAPRRVSLLTLIVVAAASAGLAGGFAVGFYKSRQKTVSAAPIMRPPSSTETIAHGRPTEEPVKDGNATERVTIVPASETKIEEKTVKTPMPSSVASEKSSRETSARPKAATTPPERVTARNDKRKDDEGKSRPTIAAEREKRGDERDSRALDEKRERRRERRERRREEIEHDAHIPRQVERAGQELNRIREIFEGRQP